MSDETELDFDAIEKRARRAASSQVQGSYPDSDVLVLLEKDVPALIAEVRRLHERIKNPSVWLAALEEAATMERDRYKTALEKIAKIPYSVPYDKAKEYDDRFCPDKDCPNCIARFALNPAAEKE